MSNDKKESSTAAKEKKRSFPWLSTCSTNASSVLDPGALRPVAASTKSSSSPTFTSSGICKKIKRTAAEAPAATVPAPDMEATKAALRKNVPQRIRTHKDKKPPLKTNKHDGREEVNEGRKKSNSNSNLLVISFQCSARHHPAPIITSSDPVHISFRASSPTETTRHAVRPAVGRAPRTVAPMFVLWVMIATLAVMVLAGRTTAVIWFCCSFCLLRWHRQTVVNLESGHSGDLGIVSGEHKKRVVLEGLLERNGKRPSLVASNGANQNSPLQ